MGEKGHPKHTEATTRKKVLQNLFAQPHIKMNGDGYEIFSPHTCHCFLKSGWAEEPLDTQVHKGVVCAYAIEEFRFYQGDPQTRLEARQEYDHYS